ncbi:hypothetical protein ANTPLA_LOCUS5321 [Anthophora plagiata]
MQDFCPLCLKNGIKKEIKLLQINLQEAVWICEEEKCMWPFGYEDFVFSQRVVGKIWSCYWNDCKPTTSRSKETSASMKHPSSIKHASNEFIANLNTHCLKNVNDITGTSNIIDSKTDFSGSHISICDNRNITRINNEEQRKCEKNSLHKEIITSNVCLDNSNLKSIKNTKTENEHMKKKDGIYVQIVKNGSNVRGIPKITSIEKTNIDISNVKIENQISVYQDPDKKNNTKAKSEIERLPNVGSTKNNESTPKSNLNVTMVEIDGLPPIKLSFEIPVCELPPETVVSNTQTDDKANNIKQNNPEVKSTFLRKSISSGKQYEKFSFSAIKKKVESCNSIVAKSNDNSLNSQTNVKTEDVKNNLTNNVKQIISKLNTCTSNQLGDSITNLASQENALSNTSAVNTSVNIDTVLEDFLTNDYNASEDINDDWIDSLLS